MVLRALGTAMALLVLCAAANAQWKESDASLERDEAVKLVQQGRALQGVQAFERVADEPPPPTAKHLLAWGTALQRLGRHKQSAEKFAAVLELEPEEPTALNNLGSMLAFKPETRARAITLLEAAVRLQPGNPLYLYNLGWAYLEEGRVDEAVSLLQRSLNASDPSKKGYERRAADLRRAVAKLPRERAGQGMPNVLLVIVDTLRADHLGAYGYERDTSPNLDALAAEGVRFEHAISQAPWTAASVASLFTGLYPSAHGLDGGIDWGPGKRTAGGTLPFALQRTLSPAQETLAEVLRRHGYATAGFVSNVYMNSIFGLAQGFDLYDDQHRDYSRSPGRVKRRGASTNRNVFEWLAKGPEEPFFLLVHYNDPHWPYDPPKPHGAAFVADYRGKLTPARTDRILRQQGKQVEVSEEDLAYLVGLYDGEIQYTDEQLGELLAKLRGANLARPLLTVLTSDHGEEFLDHGSVSHGYTLYEEQVRVPLVFHQPGRLAPRVVSAQVELLDVLPTVLELTGVAEKPPHVQGESLVPLLTGKARTGAKHAFSEATYEGERRMVRTEGEKLILGADGEALLFDVAVDPGEKENVEGARDAAKLRRALDRFGDENRALRDELGALGGPSEVVLDDEVRDQLEALGYIQ